nr:uncharacterized protein LOC109166383 [Ipomoea trifida]
MGPDNGPVSSQTNVELAKEKKKSGEHKGSSALLTAEKGPEQHAKSSKKASGQKS